MNATVQEILTFIETSRHLTESQKGRLLSKVINRIAEVMVM